MCPDCDRPNPGLFPEERAVSVGSEFAEFTIDTAAGTLMEANPALCKVWGHAAALPPLPLHLDAAMPALQRLREILCGGGGALAAETLTFWTARGRVELVCVAAHAEGSVVSVRALAGVPSPPGQRPCALDPAPAEPRLGFEPPQVARDAWLAHELRTPISAVIAYAEILKDEHFGPLASARYKGYARDIYESARHALGVVDSLLRGDPTRSLVPPLAMAELEPARVVEGCLTVVRPLAERAGLRLCVELAPHLPRVVADELSLKQMLLNLLANAIKFARPGDRVTMRVACEGTRLDICVADTGPGMAGEGVPAPWAHASPEAARGDGAALWPAGLGLGLPLTRALAAANGARLSIVSAPGEGTRATISFGADRIVGR
jgi:two-component system, cell cycle sensor histidine kinase PleC